MTGGAINIPLKDGKSINIPVDRITYDPESNQVNTFTGYDYRRRKCTVVVFF